MFKRVSFWVIILLFVMAGMAGAAVPKYFNVQGKVTQYGAALKNTPITLSVGVKNFNTNTNENGLFNAEIGPFDDPSLFNATKVDFKVNNVIIGSQSLNSVPYAFKAAVAESLASNNPNPLYISVTKGSAISGVSSAKDYSAIWGSNTNGSGVYGEGSLYGGAFKGLGNGYSGYFWGGKGAKVIGTLEATKFIGDGAGLTNLSYVKKSGDTMNGGLTVNSSNASAVSAISTAESYSAVWAKNEGKNGTGVYGKGTYAGAKFESEDGIGIIGKSSSQTKAGVYAENNWSYSNGPALEIGTGWIKIPSEVKTVPKDAKVQGNYFVVEINKPMGVVTNSSGYDDWIQVINKYVSVNSIVILTPQSGSGLSWFGVKEVMGGSFKMYVTKSQKMAFLVINR